MRGDESVDERTAGTLAEVEREPGCSCTPHAETNFLGEITHVWWDRDLVCQVHRPRTREQAERIGLGRQEAGE